MVTTSLAPVIVMTELLALMLIESSLALSCKMLLSTPNVIVSPNKLGNVIGERQSPDPKVIDSLAGGGQRFARLDDR